MTDGIEDSAFVSVTLLDRVTDNVQRVLVALPTTP